MSEPDDDGIVRTPVTPIVTRVLHYTHRNGETDPPSVPGEYWFDGVILADGGYYKIGEKWRDRVDVDAAGEGRGLRVEFRYYEDYDLFSPWQVAGQWWGPIVPPWEA